jgi:hypothetical protein
MSQRFSLFYAGFTAYAPALYFNQLAFINTYEAHEDELVRNCISEFSKTISDKEPECMTHIKTAISIAKGFEIETLPHPAAAKDFFAWLSHYVDTIERQFPMSRIDHYYFLYARKISEVLCSTGLIKTYVDMALALNTRIDLSKKIEKCLKDAEYIIFKLMAAAALLSSEPRQNYFIVYYRLLSQEFQGFKNIDLSELNDDGLKQLRANVEKYETVIMDGFKKCIGMLKELDV